ncbi:hypothetical protein [Hymenobacter sp.]|jgi:hypothetical protein|uniref:hypothetical protein n=1 Tax=Hymenobacter sp. TaxID=1898978 RepID=UPI002ED91F25
MLRLHPLQALQSTVISSRARLVQQQKAVLPTIDKQLEKLYDAFTALWPDLHIPFYLHNPAVANRKVLAAKYLIGDLPQPAQAGSPQTVPLVLPTTKWLTQAPDWSACFRTCQKMIGAEAPRGLGISVVRESGNTVVLQSTADAAIKKINNTLASGKPIIVGVNIKKGSPNFDKTTDHFVVLVESGTDSKGFYYRFFDPGTQHASAGTDPKNRLYYNTQTKLFVGHRVNAPTKHYTLSWVRPVK